MALFPLDLLEHPLDSDGLDLAQSAALDDPGDMLCGSRRYSFPAIEVSLKAGKSSSRIGVRGVLGQYGFYKHVDRVPIRVPLARPIFLFQKLDDLVDDH
jgi:hypothetical protein